MSVTVIHEKRRQEILEKALDVFVEEGYTDTTFQKISDRCGITRTILYLYFKNKREIFKFSIKQFSELLEADILQILKETDSSIVALKRLAQLILDYCEKNKKLLTVIVDFISHAKKTGVTPQDDILRRTIRMRHILSGIVINGQKKGEIRDIPIATVSTFFYSMTEAAIFKISILGTDETKEIVETMQCFIDGIAKN